MLLILPSMSSVGLNKNKLTVIICSLFFGFLFFFVVFFYLGSHTYIGSHIPNET